MTEPFQNGGKGREEALKSPSHETWIELCALSTSGTLTADEWARLGEHLLACPSCGERKRQYESVVAQALPVWAAAAGSQDLEVAPHPWPLEQAEASLMEELDREYPAAPKHRSAPSPAAKRPSLAVYLVAALALVCCGAVLYGVQFRRHKAQRVPARSEVIPSQMARSNTTIPTPAHNQADTGKYEEEIARLRAQLKLQTRVVGRLDADRGKLQQDLTAKSGDLSVSAQQQAVLQQELASAEANLATAKAQLSAAVEQGTQNAHQVAALQNEIDSLNFAGKQGDRQLNEDEELLSRDRDIRDLIGARNLYIAEIYDVAKNGATRKPFGRVFYTKDKSLIFYGYDLDQQPGIKDTSTFQAWGRSGSSEQDVSLGLFYRDDASKKRWILKCDDPRTLARLDAVFITVEPKGGSSKPTGKPILFTYLRLEPNHP